METPPTHNSNSNTDTPPRALSLDIEKYQAMLDDDELTAAQKQQLIEALWSIVVAFVDLGFGIHPLRSDQETCGQDHNSPCLSAHDLLPLLDSDKSSTERTSANTSAEEGAHA